MSQDASSIAPLFFNGESLPIGSGLWRGIGFASAMEQRQGDWVGAIGHSQLVQMSHRLEVVGQWDSEYPELMRLACLEVRRFLKQERAQVLATLEKELVDSGQAAEFLSGVIEGNELMLERTIRDKAAFWQRGHEVDVAVVKEAMRRTKLPRTDPEHQLPRHIVEWKQAIEAKERSLQG